MQIKTRFIVQDFRHRRWLRLESVLPGEREYADNAPYFSTRFFLRGVHDSVHLAFGGISFAFGFDWSIDVHYCI